MADLEKAYRRVQSRYPTARLWQKDIVRAGTLNGEKAEDTFTYIAFYDHKITNAFQELNGVKFILSNGFLSSHAYNIALCWLMQDGDEILAQRLRHNFKKFYAEVSLNERSTVIGRALLLETLAYEQKLMTPVVGAGANTAPSEELVKYTASTMTGLVQQHELGHYFAARDKAALLGEIEHFLDGEVRKEIDTLSARLDPLDLEECLCDGIAAHLSVMGLPDQQHPYDLITRLRMCAFGFLVFTYLIDLQNAALKTAEEAPEDASIVTLGSEIRSKYRHSYQIGRSQLNTLRAQALINILERFADAKGLSLYGTDGIFPLPESTENTLGVAFENFVDETPAVELHHGTDPTGRAMMQLIAEALTDHPEGTEHLLWRSKTFQQGGQPIDP